MQVHHVIYVLIVWTLARGHIPVKQPDFKSSPMNVRILENETVFLPCIVESPGESYLRWWKDDDLLSDSSIATGLRPYNVIIGNDGLVIYDVSPKDSGKYTCEMVRPKPWSSLKQTHSVQVMYPPKVFINPPDGNLEVVLGEKVKMGCLADGMPPPMVSWRTKDNEVLSSEKGKQILEFTAASRHMSGIYQCEADNGIGEPAYSNVFLRILHKPEVTVEKSWIHSAPGYKTVLSCQIVSDPSPTVEWLFEGSKLQLSPPRITYWVRGNDHVLQFNTLMKSDFGNYKCRAANRFGESEGFMELSGVPNPVVFKSVIGNSTDEFSLIWEADSMSPIFEYKLLFRREGSVKWESLTIPADSSSSGPIYSDSYTFYGLDKLSVFDARIIARNRFGWSNDSETITFGFVKSNLPKEEQEEEITNNFFSLSESTNSSSKPQTTSFWLFALWTFRFFLCICGIF